MMFLSIPKTLILLILISISTACTPHCVICDTDVNTCDYCSGGFIYSPIASLCVPCPVGHYSNSGDLVCTPCEAGSYAKRAGSAFCRYCPVGKYSYTGATSCSYCRGGSIPNANATDCEMCLPGEYAPRNSLSCLLCPKGTFSNFPDTECEVCPEGSYSSEEGAVFCESCEAGTIPNAGKDDCVSCGAGFWAEEGEASCSSCGSGCQKCKGKSDCSVCKPGYVRQLDIETNLHVCSAHPKTSAEAATISSALSLKTSGAIAKALSSGSSGAFGFGVMAKVVRNARYFSIDYSKRTQNIFAAEESSSFEINAPASFERTDSKTLHPNFVKYDVEANFLINFFGSLVPILILSGCFVIIKLLKMHVSQSKKRKILTSKVLVLFQIAAGNYLVNSLYGSFDEIVLYFMLEMQTCTFNSTFSWISFISAVVFLIVGIGFFGFHFEILKKYQTAKSQKDSNSKGLEAFKVENAQVKVLYEDFRDDSLAQQSFLASFMIRASLLNVLLCLFVDYPIVEAGLYLAVNGIFAIFLIMKRPYDQVKGAAAQYFCELIILITYSCALVLALMDSNGTEAKNLRELLEKIIVVLGITLNVGGTIFQCIDILGTLYGISLAFKAWRARLKVAKAPIGSVSKAVGHPDMTFMNIKKRNNGGTSLKISPRPLDFHSKEEDRGGLVSINGSPTMLISTNLDTEAELLSVPSTISTRKPSSILLTGESHHDLDHKERMSMFQIALSEIRIEERDCHEDIEKEEGEVFGDIVIFDYEKK